MKKRILLLAISLMLLMSAIGCRRTNTDNEAVSDVTFSESSSEIIAVNEEKRPEIVEESSEIKSEEQLETTSEIQSEEQSEEASEIPPGVAVPEPSPILNASTVGENANVTYGIDVSMYQGTIDWATVAASGIEFAIIRIGYRGTTAGGFGEDPNARYNLEEAQKNGVKIGIYFYSTAISEEEAREEADWISNYIADYSITYPIAIDCEGYEKEGHRQHSLTKEERSNVAMAFMDRIYENGYTPMIYGDITSFEKDAEWDTSRIEKKYKVWVATYNQNTANLKNKPIYEGECSMWQYSNHGRVAGIPAEVDLDVAYFGYDGIEKPKNSSAGTESAE